MRHIEQQPDLADALKQLVMADSTVHLEWQKVHYLESMGLVKPDGNKVKPTCDLYSQYFCTQLS